MRHALVTEDLARLQQTIDTACADPDSTLAHSLNEELRHWRGKGSTELAMVICSFIEQPVSRLLYDLHGHSCHQEAVELLHGCPPPFNQWVPRQLGKRARLSDHELLALRRARQQAATFLAAGAVGTLSLSGWAAWKGLPLGTAVLAALTASGLSLGVMAVLLRSLPVPRAHRAPMLLLMIVAAVAMVGAIQSPSDVLGLGLLGTLIASGLAAVVLASWHDPVEG